MRFLDIRNFQGRGKRYKPSQSPKLITLTETLIIPDITKSESNNCFLINCFEKKKKNHKYTVAQNRFDIAHGNHALRAQPTD